MSDQKPSVGRVVHYVSYGSPVRADGTQAFTSECRAAIITGIPDLTDNDAQDIAEGLSAANRADLCVLNPTGLFFNTCRQDEGGAYVAGTPRQYEGGTWHWPERV